MNSVASFKKATVLETDKKVNLLYGLNGVGKSTLSSFLYKPENPRFSSCSIEGLEDNDTILVYNLDFIRDHFYEAEGINGIFTLSKKNTQVNKEIEKVSKEIRELSSIRLEKNQKKEKNEAEYNLDLVRKADEKRYDEVFEINTKIYLGEENIKAAETFFSTYNIVGETLVVNPFIGGSAKNIKDEEYVSLLQRFRDENPERNVVIICHISEEERGVKMVDAIAREKVYLYANGGDLLNIAAIIDKGTIYLGASTGPTHIAGALQKRIVGIYPAKATQSTTRWGVFGNDKVKYLVPDENNPKENYKNPYFDKYDKIMEGELLNYIEESFLLEEGEKN